MPLFIFVTVQKVENWVLNEIYCEDKGTDTRVVIQVGITTENWVLNCENAKGGKQQVVNFRVLFRLPMIHNEDLRNY